MNSLVLEIQKDCIDDHKSTSSILRKMLVLSKKLSLKKIETWIQFEMNGYKLIEQLPEYRKNLIGSFHYLNPYNGWQNVVFKSDKGMEKLYKRTVYQSIPEIEELISESNNGNYLNAPVPDFVANLIRNEMPFDPEIVFRLPMTYFTRIVQSVKNTLLETTLELEKEGILGDGLSFSKEEVSKANENSTSILNIYGNIENGIISTGVSSSNSLTSEHKLSSEFIAVISDLKIQIALLSEGKTKDDINCDLETIELQGKKSQPNIGIIKSSLESLRTISEGVLAGAITPFILKAIESIAK